MYSVLCYTVVSVQAATLGIQGGSTVHVGDRVNITCTCDLNICFQGVHFRISGVEYNYSILEGGGVTNYNLGYTTDWNTWTIIYTLVLVNATVDDNGTTYQCTPSTHEGEGNWSNTETLTVLGELNTEVAWGSPPYVCLLCAAIDTYSNYTGSHTKT